tara:strand:- start:164835 stop:165365 length:531 start_codon:yes stop_codon:yes gene_type:complete
MAAGMLSAAEDSTSKSEEPVPTKSVSTVGDQALNLKLAVRIGDSKGGTESVKADEDFSGKVEQTSAKSRSSSGTASKPSTLKPLKRKILVFKATWCGACQSLNYEWPSMKKVGWRIGGKLTDHIQLVDSDERPDLVSKYGITALPTLVLVDDDKELARQGSLGARNIAEFYYGRLE